MAFAIDKWLDEVAADGSLTTEERAAALKLLAKDPKIVKKIEEGNLRQADYSRNMEALKQKEKDTQALISANNTWRESANAEFLQMRKDLEAERITRAQYDAKLRSIGAEYGIDEKDLLPAAAAAGAAPVVTTPPAKTDPDPQYVSREVFDKTADVSMRLPAAIADLAADHQELFGKPLKGASALVAKAFETGKPLRTVWEEQFEVQNRRDTLAQEAAAKHDADIRADERSKVLSESSLPHSRPDAPRSPIFVNTKLSENRVNSVAGVAAAVRDYNQRDAAKTA